MRWLDWLALASIVIIMGMLTYTARVGPFYWRGSARLVAPDTGAQPPAADGLAGRSADSFADLDEGSEDHRRADLR